MVPTQAYDDSGIILAWHKTGDYKKVSNYNIYMNNKLIANTNDNYNSEAKPFIYNFYNDPSNSSTVKVSKHTFTVTNLKSDTTYKFYITAVYSSGKELNKGNIVTQKTAKTAKIFDVTNYGAVGDGKTIDTKAIQAAIDACSHGGEVLLPQGKTFKSGALWLKLNMIFKVNGKLLGSDNPQDYMDSKHDSKSSKESALINAIGAKKAKNLKIIGTGVIDGNGWKQGSPDAKTGFPDSLKSSIKTVTTSGILAANEYNVGKSKGLSDVKAYSTRSNLISINNINNVYFGDGLSFENPAQRTIGLSGCNNVVFNNALIKTFDCNNGDGVDFGAKDIVFRDSALKNITDGEGEPFIFTSSYTNSSATDSYKPASDLPQFKEIYVSNCSVDISKNYAIFVAGLKDAYHEDIHFENVSFKDTKPAEIKYMKDSTFKSVTFASNIKNPWNITNSKNVKVTK